MENRFPESLRRVGIAEGGFSNDPDDPGARTLNGITQVVYDADRRRRGLARVTLSPQMIGHPLWIAERDALYKHQFWDAVRGDELPDGVDYVVFDGGVNSGPVQSVKWLQRALAQLGLYRGAIDGHVGTGTLDALAAVNDNDALIALICQRRVEFLRQLKGFPKFGRGWLTRVANVRSAGQAWAKGSVGPGPVYADNGHRKAKIETAKQPPSAAVGDLATGVGTASGVGGGALQSANNSDVAGTLLQAQDALTPLSYGSEIISHIVLSLVVIGAVLTIGGLAWRFYANWKRAKVVDALDLGVAVPL
ncbi:lysozyme family protein [Afipia massiliensis]|uniref:Lysozyme family protein n=1 Tax=Afipia massiliensis TaxID=211460 RepID=A0A840MXH4_9BRAD|nr:glycoside hydrolase family 108 protein [Afipia massiliensis]MBB5051114.1 lysozyme family protein [Afipia massiliensis]